MAEELETSLNYGERFRLSAAKENVRDSQIRVIFCFPQSLLNPVQTTPKHAPRTTIPSILLFMCG